MSADVGAVAAREARGVEEVVTDAVVIAALSAGSPSLTKFGLTPWKPSTVAATRAALIEALAPVQAELTELRGRERDALEQMHRDLSDIATLTGGDVHVVIQNGGTPRVRVYVDRNGMGYRDSEWSDRPTLADAVAAALRAARGAR